MEIGNVNRAVSVEDASVRENCDRCHCCCKIFIELGPAVFSDARNEFTEDIEITAAVACFFKQRLILLGKLGLIEIVLLHSFGDVPLVVVDHNLATAPADVFGLSEFTADTI